MEPGDCAVCGEGRFEDLLGLKAPSLTSDRRTVDVPLVKERCTTCGAVRTPPGLRHAAVRAAGYEARYEHGVEAERFQYRTADGWTARATVEWRAVAGLRSPRPGETWFELGCGAGDLMARMANAEPSLDVRGADLSARAVAVARGRGLRVDPGGVEALDGFADVIVALGVLEHAPDPVRFLAEAASRLRPGGSLVVGLPDLESETSDLFFVDHLHHWAPSHLERIASRAGLTATPGRRPEETPHFQYARLDPGSGASVTRSVPSPAALPAWRSAFDEVTRLEAEGGPIGFLGASETAAILLAYTRLAGRVRLFDDTVQRSGVRFGCALEPGSRLDDADPPVDVLVVATIPSAYPKIRARLAGYGGRVVFPFPAAKKADPAVREASR